MAFVFTSWYFVMIALVAGIVACVFYFIKMDKQDRVMIDKFIKENQPQEEVAPVQPVEQKEEIKTE